MKIFIIAAVTADGFIAKNENHAASWTSKADKNFFKETTKRAGVIVMGSRTYETIGKPLPGRRNIVLSRTKKFEGVEVSAESPTELASRLEKEGVKEIAICGGASVYTEFMKAGLVDALYLTVEPILFGAGMTMFREPIDAKLELKEARPIGDGAVVLEYIVIR
ncbi:dihydrofolate reductase family protein [Candidatus Parcubacteria bacterium]|nr:dihydrofolate reductase family protein [Candidatus Parcubacteria bacterium]